ncbi:MAG TPA: integrin, partial [Kofleriaceae bacterium]
MWDGASGVGLRLAAGAVDAQLTVTADGAFRFPDEIASGAAYTVTVAGNPASHTCVVDENASGVVAAADVTNVSIACTGPEVAVALSGNDGWRFDPALDRQTFAGSILVQDVALTVSGAQLSGALVDGAAAMLGRATSPIALPLGSRMISVTVASGGLSKTYELVFDRGGSVLDQIAYGKASNTGAGDAFGNKVALSGDTLAVAAVAETSGARGVNGDQADNSTDGAGAVYVFVRSGATWTQQAYLKASNTGRKDSFGCSLALSGNTLAVGALNESSDAAGVNGNEANDSAPQAGAVYVFVRTGATWAQQAYVKASNPHDLGWFGTSVALSGDTLAVGSTGERSAARGINGDQRDTSAVDAGAVYVFTRAGAAWTQQAYIKASDSAA